MMPAHPLPDAAAPTDLPPPAARRVWRAAGRLLVAAAFIGLLIAAGWALLPWVEHARAALDYPYPLNYGEGPLLDQAVRLAHGEDLYALPGTVPDGALLPAYTITNYPPLYVLAQSPFVAAHGASLAYGRALSAASAILASLAAMLLVRGLTRDWLAGIAAGLLLLCIPYIFFWSVLARIDMLALALSLCALALVATLPGRSWAVIGAAVLCAAAAYTRQTYLLAAPMAAFAYLWGGRRRYHALLFAVVLGCILLGVLIPLLVATRGAFVFHIVTANVNALDDRLIYTYAAELAATLPILLISGGLFLLVGWALRPQRSGSLLFLSAKSWSLPKSSSSLSPKSSSFPKSLSLPKSFPSLSPKSSSFPKSWSLPKSFSSLSPKSSSFPKSWSLPKSSSSLSPKSSSTKSWSLPKSLSLLSPWWLIAPYLLGSLATALTIAKVGSDVNYLVELCAGLCLAAGAWVGLLRRVPLLRACWIAMLAVQIILMANLSQSKYAPLIRARIEQRAQVDALFALIQAADTPILADEYLGLLPLAGRRIYFQPFEMSQLAAAGVWDEAGFLAQIERGDFPLLLLYQPYRNPGLRFERWTSDMLRVINAVYRAERTLAEATVYRR